MPLRRFTIDPPFAHQPGDTFVRVGNTYKQIRAGVEIDSRTIAAPAILTDQFHFGTNSVTELLEEFHMPGQNVSCTRVQENQTSGAITFYFSSGNAIEYVDWAAVGAVADEMDAAPDIAEKLLAMKAYRASPDGANKTTQVGASISVNGLADTPVVYTEPQ
jgi:hypothetical protein